MNSFSAQRRRLLATGAIAAGAPLLAACTGTSSLAARASTGTFTVSIDRRRALAQLDTRFAGLSFEKSDLSGGFLSAANTDLISQLRELGAGQMRIGGNSVDLATWSREPGMGSPTRITPEQIDGLAALLQQCGWRVIYGINLAANTPERAADEASYASRVLGDRLYGFELGNECDLYRYNGQRRPDYRYDDFLFEWRAARDAVSARAPRARLTGPASSFDLEGYTLPFARDEGSTLSLLTQHYYRADGLLPTSTIQMLLDGDPALLPWLRRLASAARGIGEGARIAEANSFYHEGAPGVSDADGSALWVIDFLFAVARAGCSGVDLHAGQASKAYTPLVAGGSRITAVRPGFYGMFFFNRAARGVLFETSLAPVRARLSCYAVAGDSGRLNLVFVNSHASEGANLSVDALRPSYRCECLALEASTLAGHSGVLLNGRPIEIGGRWRRDSEELWTDEKGQLKVTVAARSALLVEARA